MTLPARPLRFVRGHQTVTLESAPPDAMLLDWLREQGQYGTREGCAEGDCGACTVVLGELHDGQLQLRAVNSCIRLLSSVDGCAVFTIEDVARTDGSLQDGPVAGAAAQVARHRLLGLQPPDASRRRGGAGLVV